MQTVVYFFLVLVPVSIFWCIVVVGLNSEYICSILAQHFLARAYGIKEGRGARRRLLTEFAEKKAEIWIR